MRRFDAMRSCHFDTVDSGTFWVFEHSSIDYRFSVFAIYDGYVYVFRFIPFYLRYEGLFDFLLMYDWYFFVEVSRSITIRAVRGSSVTVFSSLYSFF